jgi:hypothetical protein
MKIYFKLLFKAFKVGLTVNIFTLICVAVYVVLVENYFKPFDFESYIQFGTIVSGQRIYNTADSTNYQLRPAWQNAVEPRFNLFIPEYQFRPDWRQPSPRLESWCKTQNCCAHRIGFSDVRVSSFRCFTLDDWYVSNRDFLGSQFDLSVVQILDNFLKQLPKNSRVIVSEPFVLFADRRTFPHFTQWVFGLKKKHPDLKFEVGIQIHLQWLDNYWVQYHGWLFPALHQFSQQHGISWGLSEFSIYDRVWKRRLSFTGSLPPRAKSIERLEAFVPDRFRRAVTLHQAYEVHRRAVGYGASFAVAWRNFPTLWFSDRIDSDYSSTFALFDWDGNPQLMYWAIARGLSQ